MGYLYEEIKQERRAEGREEGRAEGSEEGYRERDSIIIENMLAKGKIPQEIADFCGFPMSLIQQVQDSMVAETKMCRHRTLEERITAYGGRLDVIADFDWGEPKGREIW